MIDTLLAATGALFTAFVSLALGSYFLAWADTRFSKYETYIYAFLTGSAILSLIVFVLTAAHLAYTVVFVCVGLAVIGLWVVKRPTIRMVPLPPLPRVWLIVAVLAGAVYMETYLRRALGPEFSPDGVAYHTALPALYLREHHFPSITTSKLFYASFPQALEMLYLFAMSVGRHSAAATTHLAFLIAGVGAIVAWGIRFGLARPALAAAMLFFAAPVVGYDASIAYVDVAEATLCFSLFAVLEMWRSERQDRMLVLAGVLSGFAAATKYSGLVAIPFSAIYVIGHLGPLRSRWSRKMALLLIPAAILISPWLIKNYLEVGNPVSPFANRIFRNSNVHISSEDVYRRQLAHWNGVPWSDIPLEATVSGRRLGNILGPVFLLSPLALLACRHSLGRRLLFACAWFLIPYAGNIGTRFLIPALPFLSVALTLVLSYSPTLLLGVVLTHLIVSYPAVTIRYAHATTPSPTWNETLRRRPERETLADYSDGYGMAQHIDTVLSPTARIYQVGGLPRAYMRHWVDGFYESAELERLYYVFYSSVFHDWAPCLRRTYEWTPQVLKSVRAKITSGRARVWSVSEMALFSPTSNVAIQPSWKIVAQPWRREVDLAFDSRYASFWSTWEQPRPGMFLDVRFDAPILISKAVIDGPLNENSLYLAIEGELEDGRRVLLTEAANTESIALPHSWRRRIGEEFRKAGYTHFVIRSGIPGYDELSGGTERLGYGICDGARQLSALSHFVDKHFWAIEVMRANRRVG